MNKVSIYGGLGNQMFQFALAIVLDVEGIPTKISIRNFFVYNHHQGFELSKVFSVPLRPIDKVKIFLLEWGAPVWKLKLVRWFMSRFINIYNKYDNSKFNEKGEFIYDSTVFNVKNSMIIGTWQSEGYLINHEKLIKEVFNFNKPKDYKNSTLSKKIFDSNSVAVHVRRGDYTSMEWKSSHMVITDPKYYIDSIAKLRSKLVNPVFYFFSDDISWIKNNFKGDDFVFVSHNKNGNSYIDMYLMSLCKHFIIANSTFSWWAAWLSTNPDKLVIMPEPWLKNIQTPGIYPESWLPVSVDLEQVSA
ncbi:alpha-1,2-fucosyltransferase [Algoriphagus sp. C2-6-M1]|uniref:alpha-1,2-fucosyltransferase n=1 Tax=Algoriphagus persicinus TaxID=3108754 RepID=UPI002B371EE8|nr:alpha-1,2-fucosyltransferase [Algoriphagus sp. C2-6-M1]MEB2782621.1 alpha-1,2-fucosyltransferase [Algoriphagus sp. C2-6-M1]